MFKNILGMRGLAGLEIRSWHKWQFLGWYINLK